MRGGTKSLLWGVPPWQGEGVGGPRTGPCSENLGFEAPTPFFFPYVCGATPSKLGDQESLLGVQGRPRAPGIEVGCLQVGCDSFPQPQGSPSAWDSASFPLSPSVPPTLSLQPQSPEGPWQDPMQPRPLRWWLTSDQDLEQEGARGLSLWFNRSPSGALAWEP